MTIKEYPAYLLSTLKSHFPAQNAISCAQFLRLDTITGNGGEIGPNGDEGPGGHELTADKAQHLILINGLPKTERGQSSESLPSDIDHDDSNYSHQYLHERLN